MKNVIKPPIKRVYWRSMRKGSGELCAVDSYFLHHQFNSLMAIILVRSKTIMDEDLKN